MLYFPSLNSTIYISNWQILFFHRFPTAKYREMIAHSTFLEVIHHIMQKEKLICSFLSPYITRKYIYHVRKFRIHKLKINGFKTEQNKTNVLPAFSLSVAALISREEHINKLSNTKWSSMKTHRYAFNIIQTCII